MRAAASDFLDIVKRNQHRWAISALCLIDVFCFLQVSLLAQEFPDPFSRNFGNQLLCLSRFTAGVVHSFTGTGEERDQLLAIPNLYIGKSLDFNVRLPRLFLPSLNWKLTSITCRTYLGIMLIWVSCLSKFLRYQWLLIEDSRKPGSDGWDSGWEDDDRNGFSLLRNQEYTCWNQACQNHLALEEKGETWHSVTCEGSMWALSNQVRFWSIFP
jgi:hypothetical protein